MHHPFNIFLGLVLTICMGACQHKQGQVGKEEFTRRYRDSLEQRVPDSAFHIEGELEIKTARDGNDLMIYLDNAYRAYQNEPDSLSSILSSYLDASTSTLRSTDIIDKSRVIPVIKSYKYLDDLKSLNQGDKSLDSLIYYEPYNDELIIVYAEDTEHNIRYLNKKDIDTLQIAKDTLQRYAFDNLRRSLPEVQIVGGEGSYGIVAGGIYETSLILSEKIWNKTKFPVDGDIVIAIPTRDMVYITGSNNKELIDKLKVTAKEDFENENYQVSPHLFRYNGKSFERLKE